MSKSVRVVHLTSRATGTVQAYAYDGGWRLLVLLDEDSKRHTAIDALSSAPGQLVSWMLEDTLVLV